MRRAARRIILAAAVRPTGLQSPLASRSRGAVKAQSFAFRRGCPLEGSHQSSPRSPNTARHARQSRRREESGGEALRRVPHRDSLPFLPFSPPSLNPQYNHRYASVFLFIFILHSSVFSFLLFLSSSFSSPSFLLLLFFRFSLLSLRPPLLPFSSSSPSLALSPSWKRLGSVVGHLPTRKAARNLRTSWPCDGEPVFSSRG